MIVSGTHGVEGYAGSACQIGILYSDLCKDLAASTRLVFVHAINPYGFAYTRRTNEDNIDLNRNFVDFSRPLPSNSQYAEHAREFLPGGDSMEAYEQARDDLTKEATVRGGYQFFKQAMQPGQYEFPDGLYYGGSRPSWSNTTFLKICQQAFAGVTRAAVLDLHTGLGPPGVGELIFMGSELADKYAHYFAAPVSCAGARASVSAAVKGPLVTAAYDRLRAANIAICAALEFGTVSLQENVHAKIFEHWTHRHLSPADELRLQALKRFKDAYYCDRPDWQASVLSRSQEIVATLQQCLNV